MITPDKKRHHPRIGEILLDYGLITQEQLVRDRLRQEIVLDRYLKGWAFLTVIHC